jgi:hypothetical protein
LSKLYSSGSVKASNTSRMRLGTEPLHAGDGDERVRQDAADGSVGLELLKLHLPADQERGE